MNKSKQKGTRYESEVVEFLRYNGFPYAERRALSGAQDKGDISGVLDWVLECKNHKEISLSEFVDEAITERENAGAKYGAAIVKRARRGVAESYVVMPLYQFVRLIGGRNGY